MKLKWIALILVIIFIVVVAMNMKITRTTVPTDAANTATTTTTAPTNVAGPHLEFLTVTETPNVQNLSALQLMNSLRHFHSGTHNLYCVFEVTELPAGSHNFALAVDRSNESATYGVQESFTINKGENSHIEILSIGNAKIKPGWNQFDFSVDGSYLGFTRVYAYPAS